MFYVLTLKGDSLSFRLPLDHTKLMTYQVLKIINQKDTNIYLSFRIFLWKCRHSIQIANVDLPYVNDLTHYINSSIQF